MTRNQHGSRRGRGAGYTSAPSPETGHVVRVPVFELHEGPNGCGPLTPSKEAVYLTAEDAGVPRPRKGARVQASLSSTSNN
jgi:hypothetical protein